MCKKLLLNKKLTNRATEEETFSQFVYICVALLNRSEDEVWLMQFGMLLDQWECYKQFNDMAKPKREIFIDDIILFGI